MLFLFLLTTITLLIVFNLCRKQKRLQIKGKAVLVTGCDSGLGYYIAKHLYCLGFHVICGCLHVNSDGGRSLRSKCESQRLFVVSLDVTDDQSVQYAKAMVDDFLAKNNISGLWALINNAGVCVFGEFDWYSMNQCQRQVDVNLLGTIRVTKVFLSSIIASKGRVVNICSVNGQCAYPGVSVYSATKFAVKGFSDALRYEVKKLGVKVIVIYPGDFARITKIMEKHKSNADEMWNNMNVSQRMLYNDYFAEYQKKVAANYGVTSPEKVEDTSFLNDVEEAICCEDPKLNVTSATFSCRLFFCLFSKLSPKLKHLFLDLMTKYVFQFDVESYF